MKIQDDEQREVGFAFEATCTETDGEGLNLRRAG
jgi:hypothetical protein